MNPVDLFYFILLMVMICMIVFFFFFFLQVTMESFFFTETGTVAQSQTRIEKTSMCVCYIQFTREAHFTGEGYLGLKLDDVPDVPDNFYAGIGFRTDQQDGLMFYHQGQVQTHLTLPHIKWV